MPIRRIDVKGTLIFLILASSVLLIQSSIRSIPKSVNTQLTQPLNRRIYVDSRLHTLLDLRLTQPFFQRGDYPSVWWNGSTPQPVSDPWANASVANAAPFDQDFFLIMNVAVGGTTGWFPDGQGDKPWLNQGQGELLFVFFCFFFLVFRQSWDDSSYEGFCKGDSGVVRYLADEAGGPCDDYVGVFFF